MHENEGEAVLPIPGDIPEEDKSDKENEIYHDKQVQETVQNVPSIHSLEIVLRHRDMNKEDLVIQVVAMGCS